MDILYVCTRWVCASSSCCSLLFSHPKMCACEFLMCCVCVCVCTVLNRWFLCMQMKKSVCVCVVSVLCQRINVHLLCFCEYFHALFWSIFLYLACKHLNDKKKICRLVCGVIQFFSTGSKVCVSSSRLKLPLRLNLNPSASDYLTLMPAETHTDTQSAVDPQRLVKNGTVMCSRRLLESVSKRCVFTRVCVKWWWLGMFLSCIQH